MNCWSGIRCPLLLTDKLFSGDVLKRLLSGVVAGRPASLLGGVRADCPAPTDPLSCPDWARVPRRLMRLREPEPRSAFWIAGMRRVPAPGSSAAWLESRSAVASIAP